MKILIYSLVALAALITAASAQVTPLATPAIPTIGQFQSALSGLQTAAADLAAAWTALQPLLSVIASCAALAAALPHPSAGSIWTLPRKLLDFGALNIHHAKNAEAAK
jgi:hypothetical protein